MNTKHHSLLPAESNSVVESPTPNFKLEGRAASVQLHQLSLYNTGRMSPEQIIAAFAARRQQFERIVADLAAEQPESRAQHHLIVGQRGMGKTMLLARIAAELRTRDELSTRFIPLVFAEEQYAVDRLSKFWLNCLDSLADARELAGDQKAVDEIDATVRSLTQSGARAPKDDQPLADRVYDAFIASARAGGQRPVLLVDNLQLVFERLEKGQQHSLRELLMRPGSPVLVGASPSPPPQSQDYGAAFYDHFKVHYLRPLEVEEMRDLLLHLADASGRVDVRRRVVQHPARLTVLRQLTGGNPRTTLTLFFLYAEDFAPSVFGDLEGLLDRVTPLYKARFEELTAQQQVVASAIANHWDPVTAATLVERTGIAAGTISSQLDRLEKTGVVERTELFGEASIGYQLAERFFNIWFLMRSASRRQRREVEFLTRFLENFYEPTDRDRLARHLMAEDRMCPDRYLWSRAVAASLPEKETAEDLNRHTELLALREEAEEARRRMHELIDFNSLPPATVAFDELRKKLMTLVPENAEVTPKDFTKEVLGSRSLFECGEREQLASRNTPLSADEVTSVLNSIRKAREIDVGRYGRTAVKWLADRLSEGQLRSRNDAADWNRAFIQANGSDAMQILIDSLPLAVRDQITDTTFDRIQSTMRQNAGHSARNWLGWGVDLDVKLARFPEAANALREAIALDPLSSWPWACLGNILFHHFLRYEDAAAAYREAMEREPKLPMAWIGLGAVLQDHLGQFEEAERILREAIPFDPDSTVARLLLANLLQFDPQRYAESERIYHKLLETDPNSAWSWVGLANLRRKQLLIEEAEDAYRRAISIDPSLTGIWNDLGNLYCDYMNRYGEAENAYGKALELKPESEVPLQNLISLRRDFRGDIQATVPLMQELRRLPTHQFSDTTSLHEMLFAAYEKNWGLACTWLRKALEPRTSGLSQGNTDDWLRASAVLLHLNYGAELISFLDEQGDTVAKLRPWVEALRAHVAGDRRYLQNIAPEVRTTAEVFYDGIDRRLQKLPEKTRRRPVPKPKRARSPAK